MTGAVISPVTMSPTVPTSEGLVVGGRSGSAVPRRGLPLPSVLTRRSSGAVYGLSTVDARGRLAERIVVRALGWGPGTQLDIRERGGVLVVRAEAHGVFQVTGQGHLRLPAAVRHRCGVARGDRVLLVAYPESGVLIVDPPAVLDEWLAQRHAVLVGGDGQ